MVPVQRSAEAARIIEQWVAATGGTIKEYKTPAHMRVAHGKRAMAKGWEAEAPKTIDFHLAETPAGVYIRAVVRLGFPYGGEAREQLEYARWINAGILAQVWGTFNPALGPASMAVHHAANPSVPPPVASERDKAVGAVMMVAGLVLSILGLLFALAAGHGAALLFLAPGHFLMFQGHQTRNPKKSKKKR